MRNAFATELTSLAAEDERVVLLSGDIGNRLFDEFKARFPSRFLNCGVAEANMMGMAAGMALCGLRPITYTITPFTTTRCLEQIRLDVCYHNVPVIIAGTGAGFSYASLNATHHSCDDIAFLRVLPNMTVICPGDPVEVRLALRAALKHTGPVYLRLGKKGEPVVHRHPPDFFIGKGIIVREGRDICLLSTGNMLPTALQTAQQLDRMNITTRVVSFHTVKPLDEDLLSQVFSDFGLVVTLEEHSIVGGFGSSVAEWLTEQSGKTAPLLRVGARDEFLYEAGEQEHARDYFGLAPDQVAEKIGRAYQGVLSPQKGAIVE